MPEELHIQKKIEAMQKKAPFPHDTRLWIETFVYSLIISVIVLGYYLVTNESFTMRHFNRAMGDVAFLIMGISLMLSSVCYFWDFADKFIIYRKHLGLVGFGYLLLHIVISLFYTAYTPFTEYYLSDTQILSFSTALIATIIFTVMAFISNKIAIQEIGPRTWKKLMRVGFVAYAFVLVHFGVRGWKYWTPWLLGKSDSLFPSFGLISFTFGIVVVVLRIALWWSTNIRKSKNE